MIKTGAEFIYPLNGPPIRKGIVIQEDNGIILDVLAQDHPEYSQEGVQWLDGFLCPGFINMHCHLDLSALKGRIPEKTGLDHFIRHLMREQTQVSLEEILRAASRADEEMLHSGIVAVLDITGNPAIWEVKKRSSLWYHQTLEVFGTDPRQAGQKMTEAHNNYRLLQNHFADAQLSVSPHAPYSVSDELFALIFRHAQEYGHLISIHHLENEDELQYYLLGTGAIRDRQAYFGIHQTSVFPKGMRPAEFLRSLPDYPQKLVFVHNTSANREDIEGILRHTGSPWFCWCPSANLYIENCLPDPEVFAMAEEHICLGTDSLASNHQLSILEEMKCILSRYPVIETETMLKWACLNGARALGIDPWAGSLERGKAPGLLLITDPEGRGNICAESTVRVITRHLPF